MKSYKKNKKIQVWSLRQSLQKNKIQGRSWIGSACKRKEKSQSPSSKWSVLQKKEIQGWKFKTKKPAKKKFQSPPKLKNQSWSWSPTKKNWSCLKVQSKKPNRRDLQKKRPGQPTKKKAEREKNPGETYKKKEVQKPPTKKMSPSEVDRKSSQADFRT